jgi:hypothetical protein
MTRTNKRIKQGNARKIKNNNTTTIVRTRGSHTHIFVKTIYKQYTGIHIYIYKHESALLDIEHKYIQLLI